MIDLKRNNGFKWKNRGDIWLKGYLLEGNQLVDENRVFTELENILTNEHMKTWLRKTNGCYSVVIKRGNKTFIAVDIIRTFPVFYSVEKSKLIITDDPVSVFGSIREMDTLSALELESAGFVTGKRTLFRDVYQVQAGEFVVCNGTEITRISYADFLVESIDDSNFEVLQEKLSNKLDMAFERLVHSLDGRQAVVPLSGGYDSRLIATMLKKFGYDNVYTFTFGKKGNYELVNSRRTAQNLGFPWFFVEYTDELSTDFFYDNVFNEYYPYAAKGCSMFFMQDYFAVKYLHDNQLIDEDAIFIPGHSGDSIAGSHLRASVSEQTCRKKLIDQIYKKTYIQNNHRKHRKELLGPVIDFVDNQPENTPAYNIYESWVYYERHAKFIVNSSSTIDFFGYEYRLPFWDKVVVDFFKSVPYKYKLYKRLYNETAKNIYFDPYSVSFESEIQTNPFDIKKQKFKEIIRPYLPSKIRQHYLEKNDWMSYGSITKVLLADLKSKKIPYEFKWDLYNSIISKWYVESIRRQNR